MSPPIDGPHILWELVLGLLRYKEA